MLAVLEHIPADAQRSLAEDCWALLKDNGRVICTVPSPMVDSLIALGKRLGVLDGMQEHEHYGFEPSQTVQLFVDARVHAAAVPAASSSGSTTSLSSPRSPANVRA